jgi:Zn-dependent protease with chaperone function
MAVRYNGAMPSAEGPSGNGAGLSHPPARQGFAASQSWRRTALEAGVVLLALVGLLLGLRGCSGCLASTIVSQLPAQVDEKIGKTAADSMRAQYGAKGEPTPEQRARADRLFEELRSKLTADETRVLVAPRITVVVDEQVNAFALPGGEVFVLTGLMDRTREDDDMLRGVLAHELGHAVHRHGVRGLVRKGVYGIGLAMIIGSTDDVLTTLVAGAAQLDELGYTRSMEEEADAFGVDLLHRGGHGAEGLARFLESLEGAPVPQLLSTHPDSKERAKAIRERERERARP